ncbi:hypothetical protein LEP1GSC133_3181 [Leptospira borgpetersenii serovar Pomona str. 200901868]|uniref:Uncharacterized protein n=1 Tax=Leptospira borgpetersenii serovar Pomona str. 200901868 TaxID=1192866 RepID=M6W5G0_LEPBO|nr:hypothetical protein LEP1GSC133_3181 [Leptospira borgpetersenii serovar Pomona str. 200901868]
MLKTCGVKIWNPSFSMNLELKAEVLEEFSGNRLDRFLKFLLGMKCPEPRFKNGLNAGMFAIKTEKFAIKVPGK